MSLFSHKTREISFSLKVERDLLQVDTSSQILRKQRLRETIGPFDGEVFKMHEAEVHVFSDSKRLNNYLEP